MKPASATLIIKNKLSELMTLSEWINSFAQGIGLTPQSTFKLELPLVEGVTNVIEHATDDGVELTITIKVMYHPPKFTIEILDDGQLFDPTDHPEVQFPRSLDDAAEGGLGIHLIRNYTDELFYKRENDHNVLTMIMTIDS